MKLSIIYNKYLNYIVWFVILMTIIILISFNSYEKTKRSYDENKFSELKSKMDETIEDFNIHADFVFQTFQYNPKVLELLSSINLKDTNQANKIRISIEEQINALHYKFKDLGIFKFTIILKDKSTFLRFFEPILFSDDFSFRQLLNKVEQTLQPQSDFSASVYDYSYRRIYPIIKNNSLLCYIEIGLSEQAIAQDFSFDKSRISEIHYFWDESKTPKPKNLIQSTMHKSFYLNKNQNSQNNSSDIYEDYLQVLKGLSSNSDFSDKLLNKSKFANHFENIDKMYSLYFIPIYNNDKVFIGYLVHFFKNITIENKLLDIIIVNVASGAFLIILFFVIAYRKNSIEKLEQKIRELQTEKNRSISLIEQLNQSQSELKEKAEFVTKINNLLHDQDALLRKSLDEKNRFFSILAHDIKNPITSLYTNAELLNLYFDKMDENEKKEIAERLLSSSKTLDRLVRDLLEWGKLQLGQYKIELKEIKLKEEIDKIFETYSESAKTKDISFDNLIPPTIEITSDTHIIRTIFRNLVQNSIKFTEHGKIVVEIIEQSTSNIKIAFRDTGVGIPQDKIPDLFRVDKAFSTKGTRDEEGTGLGLILVNDYIKKVEGSILVESKIGVGTTFFITLPK